MAPAAGRDHRIDVSQFLAEGCQIAEDGNIEVLKSPCGDTDFCVEYCMDVMRKQAKAFHGLRALDDPHVVYYLLRWSANASRTNYLARTTPASLCRPALQCFDDDVKHTFISTSGLALEDHQWEQATFRIKDGGIGLRSAVAASDAAYLGSRSDAHELCASIRSNWAWDCDLAGSHLEQAATRVHSTLESSGASARCDTSGPHLRQSQVSRMVEAARVTIWDSKQLPDARCRRNAYASLHAGQVLGTTPSLTLDKCLSRSDYIIEVSGRLGVDVCEGDVPCKFCGMLMDR